MVRKEVQQLFQLLRIHQGTFVHWPTVGFAFETTFCHVLEKNELILAVWRFNTHHVLLSDGGQLEHDMCL